MITDNRIVRQDHLGNYGVHDRIGDYVLLLLRQSIHHRRKNGRDLSLLPVISEEKAADGLGKRQDGIRYALTSGELRKEMGFKKTGLKK